MNPVFVLALSVATASALQVELRGERSPLAGVIERVDSAGVVLRQPDGPMRVLSWDVVRAVPADAADAVRPFADLADGAWRARARLERGDVGGAEPVLEHLFARTRGTDGPTPAMIAEALCRCRLERWAHGGAMWTWLEWLRVTRAAGPEASRLWLGGGVDLPPVFDARTGLCPQLPPLWPASPGVAALAVAREWPAYEGAPGAVGELAALYRHAARTASGEDPGPLPAGAIADAGVELVRLLVGAQSADSAVRATARAALDARLAAGAMPEWQEAWCRAARGRSLLLEPGVHERRLGVAELLHVPARFGNACPALAALAAEEAATGAHALGNDGAAESLRAEIRQRWPLAHPDSHALPTGPEPPAGGPS